MQLYVYHIEVGSKLIFPSGNQGIAQSNPDKYIESIEMARQDYREGKVKNFEEIFDT